MASLMIAVSAVLVLSRGQRERQTYAHTQTRMNAFLPRVVGVSDESGESVMI